MEQTKTRPATLTRRHLFGMAVLGAALATITYRLVESGPTPQSGTLSVTDAHARAIAGTVTLIDIRRPDEWRLTGIGAGAQPIDMRRPDFIDALVAATGPDRSAPIALICARGVRSARLGRRLAEAGYTNVIDVPEGMLGSAAGPGWLASALPVTTFEDQQG